jgi:hypothetical protein
LEPGIVFGAIRSQKIDGLARLKHLSMNTSSMAIDISDGCTVQRAAVRRASVLQGTS